MVFEESSVVFEELWMILQDSYMVLADSYMVFREKTVIFGRFSPIFTAEPGFVSMNDSFRCRLCIFAFRYGQAARNRSLLAISARIGYNRMEKTMLQGQLTQRVF